MMRYLLLSVIVVCMVGTIIPNVFGQVGPGYNSGIFQTLGIGAYTLIVLIVVPIIIVITIVIVRKIMRRKKQF